jgi:metacaspase-1
MLEDAHALVIGISQYQHLPKLRPNRDAADLAAALVDPELCGYPAANVRVLLEESATRAAILAELDALAARTRGGSIAFLYFSGHGGHVTAETRAAPDSPKDLSAFYLMPVDARARPRSDLPLTAISCEELTARCAAIPAGKLTIVLDCCRAAALTEADLPLAPELSAEHVSPLARGRGRTVLAAARSDGSAMTLPGQLHSVFTGHLLRGLRGEAAGVSGLIRICDLYDYVQRKVTAEQPSQRPVFKAGLEENYPVALLRGGAPAPLTLPPPPDALRYDAFVVYSQANSSDGSDDPAAKLDERWARRTLVPYLEKCGLRVCYEHRDFTLGKPRIVETERAVAESRYTIIVFSPAYLASDFEDYQALLAAHAAAESSTPRFIPLLRHPCELTLHRRMTAALDATRDEQVPAALARLALALREPALRHSR